MPVELKVGYRGSGKTTELLEWMKAAPDDEYRVMVCISDRRAQEVYLSTFDDDGLSWAHEDQFVGPRFYTEPGWFHPRRQGRFVLLGIDDLDIHIERFFGGLEIGLATWSLPTSWAEYMNVHRTS